MLNLLKNIISPKRKKEVRIVKERKNNFLKFYSEDGIPSPTDEVIEVPNYKFYFEVYNEYKNFNDKYQLNNSQIDRGLVIWRDPSAAEFNKEFQKEYKKKTGSGFGTIFDKNLAKKIVLENDYFKHYAKDYRIVFEYVNINKREVVEELTEDKYVPPSLGYKPKHKMIDESLNVKIHNPKTKMENID